MDVNNDDDRAAPETEALFLLGGFDKIGSMASLSAVACDSRRCASWKIEECKRGITLARITFVNSRRKTF